MKELCDWLICCKHLWPEPASGEPFDLHQRNQTLHPDPACVAQTVRNIIGGNDKELTQDINHYVDRHIWPHWLALWKERHPATRIDASDEPVHWPEKWLKWAVLTMNMKRANLSYAKLDGLNVSGLELCGTLFLGCDLRGLIARGCVLKHADFSYAKMHDADLAYSKVEYALFWEAEMPGANLTGLTFSTDGNNLEGADFDGVCITGATLDKGPYDIEKNGAYSMSRNLPPLLDWHIRKKLNDGIKQEQGSLAIKYMHRFLRHIKMTPAFCDGCARLTPAKDRAALFQTFMRHITAKFYKRKPEEIASIYDAIATPVENQFLLGYIDKESLKPLRNILEDICEKNLTYLKHAHQNDPWLEFRRYVTETCPTLDIVMTRECLKDITQALIRTAKTSAKGIDSIRQSLKHLSNGNPKQAFRTLMHDLTLEQLNSLIQVPLEIAACSRASNRTATPAPGMDAMEEKISAALIRQGDSRDLIDFLRESLPAEIGKEIHVLLQDESDESKKSPRFYEGDCDYLDSYTASDIIGTPARTGGAAANLHADQMTSSDATRMPTPAWQSAFFAYMLLPTSHFLEQYAAGYSFSTTVAANDDSGPA